MDAQRKTNLISLTVVLLCILIAILIYLYTGDVLIAIVFVPPIVHWILKRRQRDE